MGSRVLIVADDLSGAGDSGVPFALREMRTLLALDDAGDAEVFVADTDSRHLESDLAAKRVLETLHGHAAGRVLFKKIDSTLRGNIAAELGAVLEYCSGAGILLCPASPATGRTVLGGVVHIDGVPLHHTNAWELESDPAPADIASVLGELRVRHVALASVRGKPAQLRARVAELLGEADVVICDAVSEADLRAVVTAGAAAPTPPVWAGSAGLADALAEELRPGGDIEPPPPIDGPALAVVGSAHQVARQQADFLAEHFTHTRRIPARNLVRSNASAVARLAEQICEELSTGDVLVTVDGPVDAGLARRLNTTLAEVCAPAAQRAGLLVLTGGETARAVLSRRGVSGLRLLNELEPGVVLSRTVEPQPGYIITKAGAFGAPDSLYRAVNAVRGKVLAA